MVSKGPSRLPAGGFRAKVRCAEGTEEWKLATRRQNVLAKKHLSCLSSDLKSFYGSLNLGLSKALCSDRSLKEDQVKPSREWTHLEDCLRQGLQG